MRTKLEVSRITIDIPKTSHIRLKTAAAILNTSMQKIVVEAIEERLGKSDKKIPNKKTLQAIKNIENRKGLVHAENIEDLFKKLGI